MSEYGGGYGEGEEEAEDRAQVAMAEKIEQDRRAAMDFVMSNPRGRQFVWDLLGRCGLMHTTFAGERTHDAAFHEGKRQVALALLADVEDLYPSAYGVMHAEAAERLIRYRAN